MKKYAIYDMDRTLTKRATFAPFLFFAAKRNPLRFLLLPVFFLTMIGYPLKLLDRKALKQIGFRLILGGKVGAAKLDSLSADYAAHVLKHNMFAHARTQVDADKAEGCTLIMATASPDFYASKIGEALGFDHVIGTTQARTDGGDYSAEIASANCYAADKLVRIEEWFDEHGEDRSLCHVRFYSDHHSDAFVFYWADSAIATNPNAKLLALAQKHQWTVTSFA
jgi:HAD superfamily hydrolase (TIGR01490 family)